MSIFSDIYGHESLKPRLKSLVELEDQTGTYLFHGPSSVGKRTTAFETARGLLCLDDRSKDCTCPSCKAFEYHPDFLCIGQKGKVKVADVESFLDFCSVVPFLSKRKVAVIDNADQMTYEAANRLLKPLEEPFPGFCFFLVASDTSYILPTILSRCAKYRFESLSKEDMINIFWKKMGIDLPKARVLGWMGYRCGMDIFPRAMACLGYREMLLEFFSLWKHRGLIELLDVVDRVDRKDAAFFSDLLMLILTDILLLKSGVEDIVNVDQRDLFSSLKDRFKLNGLIQAVSMISQTKRYAHLNVNMSMVLKNALIQSYPYLI